MSNFNRKLQKTQGQNELFYPIPQEAVAKAAEMDEDPRTKRANKISSISTTHALVFLAIWLNARFVAQLNGSEGFLPSPDAMKRHFNWGSDRVDRFRSVFLPIFDKFYESKKEKKYINLLEIAKKAAENQAKRREAARARMAAVRERERRIKKLEENQIILINQTLDLSEKINLKENQNEKKAA